MIRWARELFSPKCWRCRMTREEWEATRVKCQGGRFGASHQWKKPSAKSLRRYRWARNRRA